MRIIIDGKEKQEKEKRNTPSSGWHSPSIHIAIRQFVVVEIGFVRFSL